MNAKRGLLELANGEEILAICLGDKGEGFPSPEIPLFFRGEKRVGEALEILNFEFDGGWGGENGYSLYAWTKTKIIVKGTYDGAEWYLAIPRNPNKNQIPSSIGG